MKLGVWSGIAAALMVTATAQPASATLVYDPDNLVVSGAEGGPTAYSIRDVYGEMHINPLSQTWTSTRGGQLARLDLFGALDWGFPDLTITILDGGSDTALGTTALGSVSRQTSSADMDAGILSFDLTPLSLSVAAGHHYSFVLTTSPCEGFACYWGFENYTGHTGADGKFVHVAPDYAGGSGFLGSGATAFPIDDLNFRIAVDAPPPSDCLPRVCGPGPGGAAPEPAAWALMILGLGAAGAAMRRRLAT
jgi:hypothetical protein